MTPGARNMIERVRQIGRTARLAVAEWTAAEWSVGGALALGFGFCTVSLWTWS